MVAIIIHYYHLPITLLNQPLDCFQFFLITHIATVKVMHLCIKVAFGYLPRREIADLLGYACVQFYLILLKLVPVYTPSCTVGQFSFPHILSNSYCLTIRFANLMDKTYIVELMQWIGNNMLSN